MRLLANLTLLLSALPFNLAYIKLSDETLRSLPHPGNDLHHKDGALLAPLMRTRVPGTPGQDAAIDHLTGFISKHLPKWRITMHNSTSTTPTSNGKQLPFRNIIATRDPPWVTAEGQSSRLTLVAHFDSKIEPDGFIGATDSAAPCAMILHAMRSIDEALTKKWDEMASKEKTDLDDLEDEAHKGIQVLFLDGEEAFVMWTKTDSLYGARALAEDWEMQTSDTPFRSPLQSIEMFVLLDLLGAQDPSVPSYFKLSHWAYQHMGEAEQRLRKLGLMGTKKAFLFDTGRSADGPWNGGFIEDDHVPFMERGVNILHLIPNPFPRVWHTMKDDGEHLDVKTVDDWAMITTAFAAEWMELEGYFDTSKAVMKRTEAHTDCARDEL